MITYNIEHELNKMKWHYTKDLLTSEVGLIVHEELAMRTERTLLSAAGMVRLSYFDEA